MTPTCGIATPNRSGRWFITAPTSRPPFDPPWMASFGVDVYLFAISHSAGSKTSENLTLPGTDSTKATELLEDDLPEQAYGSNPLVLEAPQGKLTAAKYAAAVAETEKKLNSLGIVHYEQVANWTGADIERISQILDFKGRIERENWIEQARILATGGETEFSRRTDG